jgi:hypothetical protein
MLRDADLHMIFLITRTRLSPADEKQCVKPQTLIMAGMNEKWLDNGSVVIMNSLSSHVLYLNSGQSYAYLDCCSSYNCVNAKHVLSVRPTLLHGNSHLCIVIVS